MFQHMVKLTSFDMMVLHNALMDEITEKMNRDCTLNEVPGFRLLQPVIGS